MLYHSLSSYTIIFPFIQCYTLFMPHHPLNPVHPFLFILFPFNLCHSLPLILSSPPLYYSSPFHFIPHHPSLLCSSSYSWSPLIPCHPIFFIFYHLSSLPHIISFSLPTIIFPLYPMPSPPFHPHSPLPLIQHHLLLFITCHPFLLCHTIPSSLVAIFSLYFVSSPFYSPSPFYPMPYHSLLFIHHHLYFMSLSPITLYPMPSSLLYYPSPLLLISYHPFLLSIPHPLLSYYVIFSFSFHINPSPWFLFPILFSPVDLHSELPNSSPKF